MSEYHRADLTLNSIIEFNHTVTFIHNEYHVAWNKKTQSKQLLPIKSPTLPAPLPASLPGYSLSSMVTSMQRS